MSSTSRWVGADIDARAQASQASQASLESLEPKPRLADHAAETRAENLPEEHELAQSAS